MCRDGPTQAELESQRAPTVFSLHSVCVCVCVWRETEKRDRLERSIKANQNPLDFPITMKELEDKLRVLEPKKACGVDSILNEMLKHTDQSFKLAMLKLFNDVLCVGFFPEIWNKGLISPIHKN